MQYQRTNLLNCREIDVESRLYVYSTRERFIEDTTHLLHQFHRPKSFHLLVWRQHFLLPLISFEPHQRLRFMLQYALWERPRRCHAIWSPSRNDVTVGVPLTRLDRPRGGIIDGSWIERVTEITLTSVARSPVYLGRSLKRHISIHKVENKTVDEMTGPVVVIMSSQTGG